LELQNRKVKIYVDGPEIKNIKDFLDFDGFTFNPSLYRKLGAKDYLEFSKEIIKQTKDKPISIEVFADDHESCLYQANKINELSENIYVKIPITYTNGDSTIKLIQKLSEDGIKLNITAIFTLDQIKNILDKIKDNRHILSIFSGRIYDIGLDAYEVFKEMSEYIHANSKCLSLWASCRMAYDLISSEKAKADIITMTPSLIKKINMFGKSPEEYSLDTVKAFFDDAKKAKFKI
jgi:transaldolase